VPQLNTRRIRAYRTVFDGAAFLLVDMSPVDLIAEERRRIKVYLAFLPFPRQKSRRMRGKPPFPTIKLSGVPLAKLPGPAVSYRTYSGLII